MAAKAKSLSLGSAAWIQSEREQVAQFVEQELEEFGFSARNELEWLDSHMLDVFSKGDINFTDVFKTPGKLRGKTPRTARKRDEVQRLPLTDLFAPSASAAPTIGHRSASLDRSAHFTIAEDGIVPQRLQKQSQSDVERVLLQPTDSGYHGTTDDEMEAKFGNGYTTAPDSGHATQSTQPASQELEIQPDVEGADSIESERVSNDNTPAEAPVSEESFVSAKEDTSRHTSKLQEELAAAVIANDHRSEMPAPPLRDEQVDSTLIDADMHIDGETAHTKSNTSSPEKLPQRKSSFNFSSLPAREPLTASRATATRISQIDTQDSKLGRSFSRSVGEGQLGSSDDALVQDRLEESKMQSKSSTQSLQERIRLLGKRSMPQSIVYPTLPAAQADPSSPVVPAGSPNWVAQDSSAIEDADEDDWIAPASRLPLHQHNETLARLESEAKESASPARPPMHVKSISTTNILSPTRGTAPEQKSRPLSQPNLTQQGMESTTPFGSPMATRKQHDGPLSASKSRLWSALKSAKSIFASSASTSAAAKLEAHSASPSSRKSPRRQASREENDEGVNTMPGGLEHTETIERPKSSHSLRSLLSRSPSKKTRSSSESEKRKEKERKEAEAVGKKLEKEREKERQKAAHTVEKRNGDIPKEDQSHEAPQPVQVLTERPASALTEMLGVDEEMPPPPPPKSMLPAGKSRGPGRLAKPAQKPKPAPMNIRVASQASQRIQHPSQSFSKSVFDDAQTNKPAGGGAGQIGFRPASAQGNRSSAVPQNSRVKALEAAARKKEQEEREKVRKAEQKRALDAKRVARMEEEKKLEEERKIAEARKAHDARIAAQKEKERIAAEREKREEEKKQRDEMARAEQRRKAEAEKKAREAHDLAAAIERERAQQAATVQTSRNDIAAGTLRQLASKTTAAERTSMQLGRPPVSVNPAKPPKRHLDTDESEHSDFRVASNTMPLQRPGFVRGPPSYQQLDAKRRRTNERDEYDGAEVTHGQAIRSSVMAPPKRPSTMRKDTLTKFPHGYAHAPAPTVHPANMFKTIVTTQHQLQHAKPNVASHPSHFASGKIPFAENVNPPAASAHPQNTVQPGFVDAGHKSTGPFKTPARPAQAPKSAKSSPMYTNGDNIALPDIATDSEDEDDEDDEPNGFRAPSWVASPALRELLSQQQLVDPESVFGPIGELKMDEVFKNSKNQDRLKRLRERGSSAMWVESGDAVTTEEKLRDMELRERVVREGGWRYAPGE